MRFVRDAENEQSQEPEDGPINPEFALFVEDETKTENGRTTVVITQGEHKDALHLEYCSTTSVVLHSQNGSAGEVFVAIYYRVPPFLTKDRLIAYSNKENELAQIKLGL